MFKWWKARKARAQQQLFDRGFDYAAGELLRGKQPQELEDHVDGAHMFEDANEFDDGIVAALVAWRQAGLM